MSNTSIAGEIYHAELNVEQLNALFADLKIGAEIQHVQIKLKSGPPPRDRKSHLDEALQLILQEEVQAVQIRYTFEQQGWCDTLMVTYHSIRLVRSRCEVAA